MISKQMLEKLNYQINREIYSAYLYLSMSSYANFLGLKGIANWFDHQVKEELEHARKFYDYVNDQGERVLTLAIEAPQTEFISIVDLFEKSLAHEKEVTKLINDLMDLAKTEKDFATESFLQYFVSEQVEEEASVNDILAKLKFIDEKSSAILILDANLGKRGEK